MQELEEFLTLEGPVVWIGFGSMLGCMLEEKERQNLMRMVIAAVEGSECRAVILTKGLEGAPPASRGVIPPPSPLLAMCMAISVHGTPDSCVLSYLLTRVSMMGSVGSPLQRCTMWKMSHTRGCSLAVRRWCIMEVLAQLMLDYKQANPL